MDTSKERQKLIGQAMEDLLRTLNDDARANPSFKEMEEDDPRSPSERALDDFRMEYERRLAGRDRKLTVMLDQ